ncbi:hypothetical protein [Klebsiella pneumoniae]|uniref:hypothetical protein n=1 Tax=Klebsiella pneumoniae TaxID=573 RepID=UPI003CCB1F72
MTYKGYLLHAGDPKLAEYSEPVPLYADPRPEPISAEPVAWLLSGGGAKNVVVFDGGNAYADPLREVTPLYRHAQPAPVSYSDFEEFWSAYIHPLAQDDELKGFAWDIWSVLGSNSQPAPVVPEEVTAEDCPALVKYDVTEVDEAWARGFNACRAAMLQAYPVCTCPSGDGSLRWPCPVHPGNSPAIPDCWCRTCRPVVLNDMRFVVCPDCGNKRCPRANDHRNSCTGSNEPGQEGSAYPDTPREVK